MCLKSPETVLVNQLPLAVLVDWRLPEMVLIPHEEVHEVKWPN